MGNGGGGDQGEREEVMRSKRETRGGETSRVSGRVVTRCQVGRASKDK